MRPVVEQAARGVLIRIAEEVAKQPRHRFLMGLVCADCGISAKSIFALRR